MNKLTAVNTRIVKIAIASLGDVVGSARVCDLDKAIRAARSGLEMIANRDREATLERHQRTKVKVLGADCIACPGETLKVRLSQGHAVDRIGREIERIGQVAIGCQRKTS